MKTLFGEDAILREAHEKYEKFTRDKDLFYAALSREKFVRDQISREENAREEGIEQGKKEGLSIGETLGILKDKQTILKKQISRKFQSPEKFLQQVDNCSDPDKLDKALDEILSVKTADEVLKLLK